jgi:hypothetical protein
MITERAWGRQSRRGRSWDADLKRDFAIQYSLGNHTWDKRVEVHDRLITSELGKTTQV